MSDNIYSYNYSSAYTPSMPVVEIGLSVAENQELLENIIALVDSGSDGTMISLGILKKLKARYVDQARVRTVLGDTQLVNLYAVNIRIGEHQMYGCSVIGTTETNEAILGRDVLNQLVLTLNGLASVTEVAP